MKRPISNRITLLLLLTGVLLSIFPSAANAQGGLRAELTAPDLSQFPSMTTFVDVYDSQNNFVSDLDTDQFTLEENGQESIINEVSRIEPGLHTILALNLGPTLSKRITADTTRYQDLVFLISSWLELMQSGAPNLYSFSSNERAFLQRSADPQELIQTLQNYQPNLFNFEPNLSSLSYAIDVASQEPTLPLENKQVIFYVTPLPLESQLEQIPVLAARAAEIDIPIHIWLVADEASSNAPAADALRDLADSTGGQFFLYDEKVEPPDPETILGSLRYTYRLRYTSAINQSGFHRIKVTVERGVQQAETDDVAFQIELLPPEVTIIALPPQIQRVWVDAEEGGKELKPDFITLQIGVNFPDGYPRQLAYSRLLVDGEEIVLLNQAPFEWLGWPLLPYRMTAAHTVQVEVEDILGFSNSSTLRAVEIIAEQRYTGFWGGIINFFLSGGWIILAVMALFAAFAGYVAIRRRNPRFVTTNGEPAISFSEDPLTQEVLIPIDAFQDRVISKTVKQLVPRLVAVNEGSVQYPTILINRPRTIVGSDPDQVQLLIQHPSVDPVHSRVRQTTQGTVILADLDSERGTWLNYAPVSTKGIVLRNNDLIHFGEVAYRFELVPLPVNHKED